MRLEVLKYQNRLILLLLIWIDLKQCLLMTYFQILFMLLEEISRFICFGSFVELHMCG